LQEQAGNSEGAAVAAALAAKLPEPEMDAAVRKIFVELHVLPLVNALAKLICGASPPKITMSNLRRMKFGSFENDMKKSAAWNAEERYTEMEGFAQLLLALDSSLN